jgi:hypothetical protein
MLSSAAAGGEGSQDEKERGQPPQDKSAEPLTNVLSLRAPNELSPRATTNERAQALTHERSLRAPNEKRAQALDTEMSLRAADQILPSSDRDGALDVDNNAGKHRTDHCDKRPDT